MTNSADRYRGFWLLAVVREGLRPEGGRFRNFPVYHRALDSP
jgi:hypothetical protein